MNFSEAVDNDDDKLCGDGYGTERNRGCQEKQKLGVQVFWFFVYIFFLEKNVKKKKKQTNKQAYESDSIKSRPLSIKLGVQEKSVPIPELPNVLGKICTLMVDSCICCQLDFCHPYLYGILKLSSLQPLSRASSFSSSTSPIYVGLC